MIMRWSQFTRTPKPVLVIAALAVFFLSLAARAATVISYSDLLSRTSISTLANHEIKFLPVLGVDDSSDTIALTFGPAVQPTFSLAGLGFDDVDLAVDNSGPTDDCSGILTNKTLAAAAGVGTWGVSVAGQTVTLAAPTDAGAGEIDPGSCVIIRIGTNAVIGAAGNNQILNPGSAGAYSVILGGAFGDEGSASIGIADSDQITVTATVPDAGGGGGGGGGGNNDPPAPPIIFNVRSLNVTETGADVLWDTNVASTSFVDYGPTVAYGSTSTVGGMVFNHSVPIAGLTPGATYHYRVRSTGAGTAESVSGDFSFMTPDATGPVITNVRAVDLSGTSARIIWDTDEDADSRVDYGPAVPYAFTASNAARTNAHSLVLNGLQPNTLYRYVVKSKDAPGNSSTSQEFTFTTLDTIPPVISNISVDNINQTTARINWATDELADSRVEYGVTDAYGSAAASGNLVANHIVALANLAPGTQHHFVVISRDASGNSSTSTDQTFTTLPDAIPPSNVANLAVTPGDRRNKLAWTNPADNDFAGVRIRRSMVGFPAAPNDGVQVFNGIAADFVDVGLTNGTRYYYTVFAYDASGNFASGTVGDGTPNDGVPPGPVANLDVTPGDAKNRLEWTMPGDADLAAVRIRSSTAGYPAGPNAGDAAFDGFAVNYTHLGLINGVRYYYSVFARDASGNYSAAAQADGTPVGVAPAPACGNLACEAGETHANCPADCAAGPSCGNALCEAGETALSCPADCGAAPACGNAICEAGETTLSCAADCPAAPAEPPIEPPPQTNPDPIEPDLIQYFAMNRALLLHRDAQGFLHTLPLRAFSVIIPSEALPKPLKQGVLNFDTGSYLFSEEEDGTSYYADVSAPGRSGMVSGTIILTYDDATNDVVPFELSVDPLGRVVEKRDGADAAVPGATITLRLADGSVWSAASYRQANPGLAAADGTFGFMVPRGRYVLEVRKEGYRDYVSSPFDVATEVVNPPVELIAVPPSLAEVIVPGAPVIENLANVARAAVGQGAYVAKIFRREIVENPAVRRAATSYAAPAAVLVTTAVVATAVQTTSLVSYLYFLVTQPILLIGRRRRRQYGVIYNSLSKLPVDLAIVRLYRVDGRLARTLVTDKLGRYAFLVDPGDYRIEARKPGLLFPSNYLKNRREDGKYLDLYHGETISVGENGAVITANVPMDPSETPKSNRRVVFEEIGRKVQNALAPLSVVLTFVLWLVYRDWYLFVLFAIQGALYFLFRRLARPQQPKNWGIVYDENTRKPIPFAIARVIETQYNKVLESRVTDAKGRYNFLVGGNRYYVSVEKPGYEAAKSSDIELGGKEDASGVVSVDIPMRQKKNE